MESLNIIHRTARIDAKGREWIVVKNWKFFEGISAGTYSHKDSKFRMNWYFCDTIEDQPESAAIEYSEKRSLESA